MNSKTATQKKSRKTAGRKTEKVAEAAPAYAIEQALNASRTSVSRKAGTANPVTDSLDIWTSATIKKATTGRGSNGRISAYGIQKLRELILELAVRGRLVPQDPEDEPASLLLKQVEFEKKGLLEAGKIKSFKKIADLSDEEITHSAPSSWQWVRFGQIAQHNAGKTLDRGRNSGVPREYITTSNLYWGFFDLSETREMLIREDELEKCTAQKGDLLICEGGEAGRAAVWGYDKEICFQNHIHRARLFADISPYYVYRLFEKLSSTGEINKYRKGVGISNMSGKALASIPVPLPPLAEQHRIVAKVDELMAMCDRLEQQQTDSLATHQTLVETLLAAIVRPAAGELGSDQDPAAILFENFDTLFTTEQSIDQLKQTILQLAVMGKLVSQDPNDEPASVLLDRIAEEKARLVIEGKIKKQKELTDITEEEKPFESPAGWKWVKLGDISADIHYGYTASANPQIDDVRLLRITDIQDDSVKWGAVPGCEIDEEKIDGYRLQNGDILIARTGGTIGKSYLVENINLVSVFASYLIRVRHLNEMFPAFVKVFLGSQLYWDQLYKSSMGTGQPNVNGNALKNLLFALPPLAEQHRIVAKVDELMVLCDTLKARLQDAQTTQVQLADAVVERAVNVQ